LAGIPVYREDKRIIRPLLFADHSEIQQYAAEDQLTFRPDHADEKDHSNFIRDHILPRVREQLNPNVIQTLHRSAELFRELEGFLTYTARQSLELITAKKTEEELHLSISQLRGNPVLLQQYIVMLSAEQFTHKKFEYEHVGAVLALMEGLTSSWVALSKEHIVFRDGENLVMRKTEPATDFTITVLPNQTYEFDRFRFASELTEVAHPWLKVDLSVLKNISLNSNRNTEFVDADKIQNGDLILRTCSPDDSFVPLGMKKMKKISDFLIDSKIPIYEKHHFPILATQNGEVIWVCGLCLDDRFKVTDETKRVMKLEFSSTQKSGTLAKTESAKEELPDSRVGSPEKPADIETVAVEPESRESDNVNQSADGVHLLTKRNDSEGSRSEPHVLLAQDLQKFYGPREALRGLSFSLRAGCILGFLGPNGAGKTTAIRILTTILEPDSGYFVVDGISSEYPGRIRRRIGVLPESLGFHKQMTAIEWMVFFGQLYGRTAAEARANGQALLKDVGLDHRSKSLIGTYSRGMQQRLGIARMLVNDPAVVFLDEPTLGLDPQGQQDLLDLVWWIARERNAGVVLCSHDLPEAESVCDDVVIMNSGRIVVSGTVAEVIGQTRRNVIKIHVPSWAVVEAQQVLEAIPNVTKVTPIGTVAGWLGLELVEPADKTPNGENQINNKIVEALIQAEIPILSFEAGNGRLQDVFLHLTGEKEPQ
jgi:ABC-2 type transport system ATP-binding protein